MNKIIFFTNKIKKTGGSEKQLKRLINKFSGFRINISIYDYSNEYPDWIKKSNVEIISKNKDLAEYKYIIPWGGTNTKTLIKKFLYRNKIIFTFRYGSRPIRHYGMKEIIANFLEINFLIFFSSKKYLINNSFFLKNYRPSNSLDAIFLRNDINNKFNEKKYFKKNASYVFYMKCRNASVKRIDLFKKIQSKIENKFLNTEFILEVENKVASSKKKLNKLEIKNYLKEKNVIFLMLSDTEGMPNTVTEAILEDMLVISRDIGDVFEVLPIENILPKTFKSIIYKIETVIFLVENDWNKIINKQRYLLKEYIKNADNDFNRLLNLFFA